MNRRHCLWILCGMLATAAPCQAHFLFVRVLPHAEAGRFAEVVFSDQPDAGDPTFIDKIAHTQLWLQSQPGTFQPLKVIQTSDRLRSLLPSSGALAVVGRCDYGVLARPKKTPFLLRHFPRAVAGDPKLINALTPKTDLPLEIACSIDGDRVVFTALRDGKPLPRAEFNLLGVAAGSSKLVAGADGTATWQATPGSIAVYLGHTRNQAGLHDGQKYDEIRDFCSLSFTWPLQPAGADAEALALFRQAIAARHSWKDFPGFSADLEAFVGGRTVTGSITVSAGGDVAVNTLEEIVAPWVQERLDSIVLHRRASAGSGKTAPTVYFGDRDKTHPLGRLVVFEGGKFASSYRVRDNQLMTVNRHLGKTNMTITILENDVNAEGKVLPRSYTVQSWDAVTGQLLRTEAVQERWQRIAGVDLPVLHQATESSEAGVAVRVLRLSGHKLQR